MRREGETGEGRREGRDGEFPLKAQEVADAFAGSVTVVGTRDVKSVSQTDTSVRRERNEERPREEARTFPCLLGKQSVICFVSSVS